MRIRRRNFKIVKRLITHQMQRPLIDYHQTSQNKFQKGKTFQEEEDLMRTNLSHTSMREIEYSIRNCREVLELMLLI